MKTQKDERKHLGDRLPAHLVDTLKKVSKAVKISKQQLAEDAIMMWMGHDNPMADLRRKMALQAFKSGDVERPFNFEHANLMVAGT